MNRSQIIPSKYSKLSNHPDFLVGSLNASRSAILDDTKKIEALVRATLSDLAMIIHDELAMFEILVKTEKEAFVPIENIIKRLHNEWLSPRRSNDSRQITQLI
jgi:hypothetical protein